METNIINNIIWSEFEKNVCRLKEWTPEQRQIRLENLHKSINQGQLTEVKSIVFETGYDENFLKRTGINYSNPDFKLLEVALLDYIKLIMPKIKNFWIY